MLASAELYTVAAAVPVATVAALGAAECVLATPDAC